MITPHKTNWKKNYETQFSNNLITKGWDWKKKNKLNKKKIWVVGG